MADFNDMSGISITSPESGQGIAGGGGNVNVSFSRGSIRYDSPFLDMTSTFIPKTIKGILKFISAYVVSDGLLSQCVSKMSEYPITALIYGDDDKNGVKNDATIDKWKNILENSMNILRCLKQAGMDYYAYGNSIVSINYPFKRMLKCPKCNQSYSVDGLRAKFENFKFMAECPDSKCAYRGEMEAKDVNTKEISKLGLVHWDLLYIDIKYNSITGDHFFYYTIPADLQFMIRRGDMDIVNGTRLEIIKAVEKRKQLKLMADNVFHLKRAGPQYIIPAERGWGIPAPMAVLKDVFHTKVLKKGNEMVAFDHIVPLRILFPQPVGDISPHATISLSDWRSKIEQEIRRWRADPNYISIVPIPLGMQNFSGDAKMLMITPEIRETENTIITGMGIIPEIIKGGATWSGSNVSLRVIENSFINHRSDVHQLLKFVVRNIAKYMDIPELDIKMTDFKMADDLEKKRMMMQAAMQPAGDAIISKTTIQRELDLDVEREYKNLTEDLKRRLEIKIQEAEGIAEANGAAGVVQALFGADAQIEQARRMESNQKDAQAKHDMAISQQTEQNAMGVQDEIIGMAQMKGHDPATISMPNLILMITQRFAKLATMDPDEYKIRLLAMKSATPSLYQEVYKNLKEMNLIVADTIQGPMTAEAYSAGQVPLFSQGGATANDPTTPAAAGASPTVIQDGEAALPVQRPPRSDSPKI